MQIRGTTAEERRRARRARTAARRAAYYRSLLSEATDPDEQLRHACDYLRAIANDLPNKADVTAIARKVAQLADEESTR